MTKKQHVGFFSAIRGTFCDYSVFRGLIGNSWGRVIWHLLLWSILVGALIATVDCRKLTAGIDRQKGRLTEVFGKNLSIMSNGILIPQDKPEMPRQITIADCFVSYAGDGMIRLPDHAAAFLVVWNRSGFALAIRRDREWHVQVKRDASRENIYCSNAELPRILNGKLGGPAGDAKTIGVITFEQLCTIAAAVIASLTALGIFLQVALLPWILTGIFMLITVVFGGKKNRRTSNSEFWRIGLYAGMPAMLVAAAFPVFDLPLFTYRTAYMIGMTVCWMAAAMRVERSLADEAGQPPEPPLD